MRRPRPLAAIRPSFSLDSRRAVGRLDLGGGRQRCSWSLRELPNKWADRHRAEGAAGMVDHDCPGSPIHVDVTKFVNIPDGGGHTFLSQQQGKLDAGQTARHLVNAAAAIAARSEYPSGAP
jgi:hypothetical protein